MEYDMQLRKKTSELDVLKELGILQDEADRIFGGLMRIEMTYGNGKKFIKKSLKLAKNQKQTNLIWYAIGLRIGLWRDLGIIVPHSENKKLKHGNIETKKGDPAVQ